MLEALAADETLKATQRLRALEELGRIRRRDEDEARSATSEGEDFEDPMADLWEVELVRRKAAGRAPRRRARQAAEA